MLGRNAARPFGMTPSRLVAIYGTAASHRLSNWISKPFALVHLHRYLSIAPQLLLTNPPTGLSTSSSSGNKVAGSASASSSTTSVDSLSGNSPSSSHKVHTSAISQQEALQQQNLLISQPLVSGNPATLSSTSCSPTAATATATSTTAPTTGITSPSSTPTATTTSTTPALTTSAVAFNYLLAASWHPKTRSRPPTGDSQRPTPPQQSLGDNPSRRPPSWQGPTATAAATKRRTGKVDAGEDAFFHVSTPSRVALGVADGVGGWSELGVDPALFSWALMENAEYIARSTDLVADIKEAGEIKVLDAQTILDGAYSQLIQSGNVEAGSSTACILSLCKLTGTLRASNLGDSSFLLIRNNECIYESPSQQHFWNCPYQLTVLPPSLALSTSDSASTAVSATATTTTTTTAATPTKPKPRKSSYIQDLPKDAVQTAHQLQDGDVIVLATDGFWDNVFTKETIELVQRELGDIIMQDRHAATLRRQGQSSELNMSSSTSATMGAPWIKDLEMEVVSAEEAMARVRALSQRLTNTARRFSLDTKRRTPFSQGARHLQAGGKVDDITVIVTLVRSMASSSSPSSLTDSDSGFSSDA